MTHQAISVRPRHLAALLGLAAMASAAIVGQPSPQTREDAYRANNLGVALLEQYDYDAAAAAFRRALQHEPELSIARLNLAIARLYAGAGDAALDDAAAAVERLPSHPHAHYVYGLAARALDRTEEAVGAFERVLALDPADAGSLINLGQIALQGRRYADALDRFRRALAVESFNVTAAYGVATALARSGQAEQAREAMQRFEALRDAPYGVTFAQRYLEQGRYGEAIASTGAEPDLVDAGAPRVAFTDATSDILPSEGGRKEAGDAPGSLALFDADGDGDLDLFVSSGSQVRFLHNQNGRYTAATSRAALARAEAPPTGAVAADYDNDGRRDLLLLARAGVRLLRQEANGRFTDVTAAAGLSAATEAATAAAFVDVDHDGDLDIVLPARPVRLYRSDGKGRFTDIAAEAGFANGMAPAVAVVPTDFDNRRDIDVLLVTAGESPRLMQNMRDGTFRDTAAALGLPAAAAYSAAAAADVNKDGYTDFFFGRSGAAGVFVLSDGRGRFTTTEAPGTTTDTRLAQFVDVDNDGLIDLLSGSRRELRYLRNLGTRWDDLTDRTRLGALAAALSSDIVAVASGDLDADGDADLLVLQADGGLRAWRSEGAHRSLRVLLAGRVSNRDGIGSKVEMRAGSLRQRIETAAVTPAIGPADILFGLGTRFPADVVRVIWPSGTLQAETVAQTPLTVTELDRKPSSCPYLYTWNGSRFEFVTDFLGGGEIGYWQGPGRWNTPDPDEYVRIPPGLLAARAGRYELRVTNELEEALFVDRLELVAIDHAREVDVYPNEGLGAPRAASFLTTTRAARPLQAAVDGHGHDVLAALREIDGRYPDDFTLLDIRGYAEPHTLRLDIGGGADQAVLLATGWTDYAFSGDNVAAHQRGLSLRPPALEVRAVSGEWRPLIESIGIPVGRPQTVVVDLRGRLRPGEREVRILTNMRIYWDRILVDTSGGGAATRVTRLDPAVAELRWRGFSAAIESSRLAAPRFDYDRVSRRSIWKAMLGRYTREGDVRELLRHVDDMFVISQPGDELALAFDAAALPALADGQRRTFLLYADGYSKEMDIRSATPYTVAPLPFHAMTRYPYGGEQRYPSSPAHRDYQERYNTRVVSRSLPPLETGAPPPAGTARR